MKDVLGYEDRIVVVTGASSGIGQETARMLVELGAVVYALGRREVSVPVKQYTHVDLLDKDSIDAAVTHMPDRIDALFNCAGSPGTPFSDLDTALVNFVGLRHFTEALLPRIPGGGAIASVSSVGGLQWMFNMDTINEFLVTPGFDEARAWLEANPERCNGYVFSKECVIVYTKTRAPELARENIRINCVSPTITDTPMFRDYFVPAVGGEEGIIAGMGPPCGRYAQPEEMAGPLIWLNSKLASFVSGRNLCVDYAWHPLVPRD